MQFLFSGEGATDCGTCAFDGRVCEGEYFEAGPMVHLTSQMVEAEQHYSPFDTACCALVNRATRNSLIDELKRRKKMARLPGRRRPPETLYFERSAQALARWAKEWERVQKDSVVAVLFHDADTKNASRSGIWKDKHDAMLRGFKMESFERGVPMIPKPTSEAWLLCALKDRPYENCHKLEERSGSPKAESPLKKVLQNQLGKKPTRELLCSLIEVRKIDPARIDMPSFNAFRDRLKKAISKN